MNHKTITLAFQHRVAFTHGAFRKDNETLRDLIADSAELANPSKVIVFVDEGLNGVQPDLVGQIQAYFAARGDWLKLVSAPVVIKGGEACKNDWSLVDRIWQAINFHSICRHSYVIAVGGGAFMDLVGFAATTAHRGIRLIRMPSTTLSQGDGGVGVKNGVNYFGKKNWIGTFSVPFAVVNDLEFLQTLPEKERRAGIVEAIKVAAIRNREFFDYIDDYAEELGALQPRVLERVIRKSAEIHVEHIATSGDPFEFGSARPLDFGHWVAHKLEQLTDFRVGHGEAVAIGMAVDILYAVRKGLMTRASGDRILRVMEVVGFDLWSDDLLRKENGRSVILQGLEEFREHLGGRLTITLVPEIGRKIEVHEMDEVLILEALEDLRARYQHLHGAGVQKAAPASDEN